MNLSLIEERDRINKFPSLPCPSFVFLFFVLGEVSGCCVGQSLVLRCSLVTVIMRTILIDSSMGGRPVVEI